MLGVLLCFERVFTELGVAPLLQGCPDVHAIPEGPAFVGFDRVRLSHPAPAEVPLSSLEDVGVPGYARRGEGVAQGVVPRRAGAASGAGGIVGSRKGNNRAAAPVALRQRRGAVQLLASMQNLSLYPCVPPWTWCPKTGKDSSAGRIRYFWNPHPAGHGDVPASGERFPAAAGPAGQGTGARRGAMHSTTNECGL